QLVAVRAEPEYSAVGGEADIGVVAKALAPENVRQMHFDDRQVGGVERVEHGDRGVGQRAGVEDDAVRGVARLVNPVDELAFVIGLAALDRQVERAGAGEAALLDIGERVVSVGCWLGHPEQVDVRAVEHKNEGPGRASAAQGAPLYHGSWAPNE